MNKAEAQLVYDLLRQALERQNAETIERLDRLAGDLALMRASVQDLIAINKWLASTTRRLMAEKATLMEVAAACAISGAGLDTRAEPPTLHDQVSDDMRSAIARRLGTIAAMPLMQKGKSHATK